LLICSYESFTENESGQKPSLHCLPQRQQKAVSVSPTLMLAVMKFLREEIESAIERSFTILKTRIDKFGTSAPNIQRLPNAGRIQIEIPGAGQTRNVSESCCKASRAWSFGR